MISPSVRVKVPFLGEGLPAARKVAGVRSDQVPVTTPTVRPLVDLHFVLPIEYHVAHSAPSRYNNKNKKRPTTEKRGRRGGGVCTSHVILGTVGGFSCSIDYEPGSINKSATFKSEQWLVFLAAMTIYLVYRKTSGTATAPPVALDLRRS